jgi:glyoxylase-like metal-dependent hydrolase (beta-lactamase superfamily II)
MRSRGFLLALLCALLWTSAAAHADSLLRVEKIAPQVYALIGPTGPRTYANYGLNANFGLVVTPTGAILIDSGTGSGAAEQLAKAAHTVTDQPIRWVINTGSQDHRWLGNGYFAAHGARVYALQHTVRTQKEMAANELAALKGVLKQHLGDTRPVTAPHPLPGDRAKLVLGGVHVELNFLGNAHFPGDAVVWLPRQHILFSGDLIFTDRMLGILPQSNAASWERAFRRAERQFPNATIVPGHGSVGGWQLARADTGDYLHWLLSEIRPAVENWDDLETTVTRLRKHTPQHFMRLEHAQSWNPTNINRTFVQLQQSGM